jgi:uncharacterized membrane protein YfcA
MEFWYMVMPISGVEIWWPGLIILGWGVGVIGSFFGMGGAWMITPGLNILGFPMAFAIGTDIAHMAGKTIVSTLRHSKFGNVDYILGFSMIAGTIAGFEVGAQMVMWLERIGNVTVIVRWIYVVLLTWIAWMVFYDLHKRMQKEKALKAAGGAGLDKLETGVGWAKALHKIAIPPMINLKVAGVYCSAWLPIFIGFMTGWIAGILGIGGGLIRMPALLYFVGCPTHVAVGTDLFEVMISGLYGAGSYTYKGRTELIAAMIMLIGAGIGAQFGAIATKYVKGYGIRVCFGIAVCGCNLSIIFRLLQPYFPQWTTFWDRGSTTLILGLVGLMSTYIVIRMVMGASKELEMKKKSNPA